jgi:hypothetical protein
MSPVVMQTKGLAELEIGQDRWVSKNGRYPIVIEEAKPSTTKQGMGSIKLRGSVNAPGTPDDGVTFFDDLTIEGPSAAYFKRKLRQLGIPVEQDGITDEQICAHVLGKQLFADLENEVATTKESNFTEPKKILNAEGQEVIAFKSRVKAYYLHNVSSGQVQAPAAQVAAPVAQAPLAAPAGFGAPQAAPLTPPGFPAAQTQAAVAPQGFAQAPAGFGAPPAANGGAPAGFPAPQGGVPGWAQPQAAAPAQAEAGGGGKRGKKG